MIIDAELCFFKTYCLLGDPSLRGGVVLQIYILISLQNDLKGWDNNT
jgi:hypothetical protein